jgi:hypothetical protein
MMGVAYLNHPTMGLMGFVFLLGMVAASYRATDKKALLRGLGLFVGVAGIWTFLNMSRANVVSSIAGYEDIWFALMRYQSSHLDPLFRGVFTSEHEKAFLPFVCFVFWIFYFMFRASPARQSDRRFIGGMMAILALVGVGLLNAAFDFHPTLTKLAFPRANELIALVGSVYICSGAYTVLRTGGKLERILVLGVFLQPFFYKNGMFSLLFTLLAVLFLVQLRTRNLFGSVGRRTLLSILGLAPLVLFCLYLTLGYVEQWRYSAYFGEPLIWRWWAAGGAAVLAIAAVAKTPLWSNQWTRRGIQALWFVGILAAGLHWQTLKNSWRPEGAGGAATELFATLRGEPRFPVPHDYQDLQLWAQSNTPKDALFLVDPGYAYGWRAYSQRSSFGSAREWLYTQPLYATDVALLKEGLRRARIFGIDVRRAVREEKFGQLWTSRIQKSVRRTFYGADEKWLKKIAEENAIDYAVFEKALMTRSLQLPAVYENAVYQVVKLR